MNKIRCRTIGTLEKQGIDHRLLLIPTRSLFDKAELNVYSPTVEQVAFLKEHFKKPRPYQVKVSRWGSAQVHISLTDVVLYYEKDGLGFASSIKEGDE
jgi:hypothetical protein